MSDDQVPSGREACHDLNPDWQPGDPITYIYPEAPAATVPPYDGERYQALVPDTFDVAERARQVINPLTEATDADADREIYFMGVFCVKPALLCHGVSDANVQPKFQLTVPLMRMISGSEQNLHVEAEWLTRLRRCIGPEGLYLPASAGQALGGGLDSQLDQDRPRPGPVPESLRHGHDAGGDDRACTAGDGRGVVREGARHGGRFDRPGRRRGRYRLLLAERVPGGEGPAGRDAASHHRGERRGFRTCLPAWRLRPP